MTEAVNQVTSLQNANKLAARSTDDLESFDNSDSGENDEVNDGRNRVTIHETDCSPYNETDLAASFLSHQETSSSSMATAAKPEDDLMVGSVFKEFSESSNQSVPQTRYGSFFQKEKIFPFRTFENGGSSRKGR